MAQVQQKTLALGTTAFAAGAQAGVDVYEADAAGAGAEIHAIFVENVGVADAIVWFGRDIGVVYDVLQPECIPAGAAVLVEAAALNLSPGQRFKARASAASTLTLFCTAVEK